MTAWRGGVLVVGTVLGAILGACGDDGGGNGGGDGGGIDGSFMTPDAPPDPEWTPRECTGSDVLCVNRAASGTEAGTAGEPFHTIQAAVDAASSGAFVQVAGGTYAEDVVVNGKTVELYGGFPGGGDFLNRDRRAHVTTIQGSGASAAIYLSEAGDSVVDGFTITGGAGYDDGYRREGGGVYASGGAPTISYNVIEGNVLPSNGDDEDNSERGGGIRFDGDVRIIRNEIRDNRAERGAAIYGGGGGFILRNVITDNRASGNHGGAIYVAGGHIELAENFVGGNEIGTGTGYGWGGGIFVDASGGVTSAALSRNVVTDNFAPSIGSGVFIDNGATATLTNELYFANRCPETGGAAFYADSYTNDGGDGSIVTIENSTIADHPCTTSADDEQGAVFVEGADSAVTIRNSIFWGNGGKDFHVRLYDPSSGSPDPTLTVSYTLSEQAEPGTGNLQMDPLFVNPAGGDYHLESTAGHYVAGTWVNDSADSPAIDSGDPASDYSNEPTPNGGRVNLGSFGNTAEASKSN